MAMAKSDLVVVTDAPPKSMNPHASLLTPTLSYMSNFFDGLLQRPAPGRQAGTGPGRQMGPGGWSDLEVRAAQGRHFSQRQ
jgi:hypothetical protein